MEIILTKACEALTGMLDRDYGYYIRRAPHKDGKVRFFGQRSKWSVPPDGHLRFILKCAELAQMRLHIVDIQVSYKELRAALDEAGRQDVWVLKVEYGAYNVRVLDKLYGLSEGLKL